MLANATRAIRLHPVRCAAYTLLAAAVAWAGVTTRGILRGERNALVTRVAQSGWLRGWVEREFHVRYSIESIALAPQCGFQVDVRGVTVELVGAAAGGIDAATVCLSGSSAVTGVHIGPQLIDVNSLRVDWPRSVEGENAVWRDARGELVSARHFTVSPGGYSGGVSGLRVLDLAAVDSAAAVVGSSLAPALEIRTAVVSGVRVSVTPAAIAQAPARFQAAANTLQNMGEASLPFVTQWSATAQRLLRGFILGGAALLLALKVLVTRAPGAPLGQVVVILAPFAAIPLLALTHSWVAIVIAAPLIAIALWALAYRRSSVWPQRLEPAAVDVLAALLALPVLLLLQWPAVAAPKIPAIDQVSLAQLDVTNTAANVQEAVCGSPVSSAFSVPKAGLTNLRVTLDGAKLKTLDIGRVAGAGEVRTGSLAALQKIRYLPARWKSAPSIAFCASAAIRNAGNGRLPETVCPAGMKSPAVIASLGIDYTGQAAQFAVNWIGGPAPFVATGSAGLNGARIDNLHTASGAIVKIANGAARVTWDHALAVSAQLQDVEAGGVAVEGIGVDAGAPLQCGAGPVSVIANVGKTSYAFGGNQIVLDNAALNFTRPRVGAFSGTARTGALTVHGTVEASITSAEASLTGSASPELIPRNLTLETLFSTPSLAIATPVRLSADLWSGDWQIATQPVIITQDITTRVPRTLDMDLQAAGGVTSVNGSLQADARARVGFEQLVPNAGPVKLTLNDLAASAAWDSSGGLAPVKISTGWNVLKPGQTPANVQLTEVSSLRLSTRGNFPEPPAFAVPSLAVPPVPTEFKFRLEGTPQSISIFPSAGPPLVLDGIVTSGFKASLPGLRLQSAELQTDLRVKWASADFPVSAKTRLTDTTADAILTQPLAAELSTAPESVGFSLTRPLDTERLLKDTGFTLQGVTPRATLSALQVSAGFAGTTLVAVDAAGAVAPGPLVSGSNFEVSQGAPSTFHVTAPSLPAATVAFSAPSVAVLLNGGKDRAWFAADGSVALALSSASPSPFPPRISEAAAGLLEHALKANLVFGGDTAAAYPVQWDVEVNGAEPAVTLGWRRPESSATGAVHAGATIHSLVAGKQSLFGFLSLSASARMADDHLIVDLNSSGDIGALGQSWRWSAPLQLALRNQLRPGPSGELFASGYYDAIGGDPGPGAIRVAIGYGPVLQLRTGYRGMFFSSAARGEAQAAITWSPDAAYVDSFGDFNFQGLEAGAISLPNAYLEDRLDGEVRFAAKGFRATGLTLPRLLSDASSVHALDHVDLFAQVRSAGDEPHLPGIAQAETALTLKPAGDLLRLLTGKLSLSFPPRAVEYQRMAFEFQVSQGTVRTEPALLTLTGVRAPGVQGLAVDSDVRVHWGGAGVAPAPRLRDLIYAFQRVMEP